MHQQAVFAEQAAQLHMHLSIQKCFMTTAVSAAHLVTSNKQQTVSQVRQQLNAALHHASRQRARQLQRQLQTEQMTTAALRSQVCLIIIQFTACMLHPSRDPTGAPRDNIQTLLEAQHRADRLSVL